MEITKIKRTISFGNHENITLEAELSSFDDAEQSHEDLVNQIREMIDKYEKCKELSFDIEHLGVRREMLRNDISVLEGRKQAFETWLAKYTIPNEAFSIDPNEEDDSDIPF